MRPAKAATKRRKFDLKTFLFNHLRWQDYRGRFQTRKRSLLKTTRPILFFTYTGET